MTGVARETGSEFVTEDAFIPTSFAAHAATVSHDGDVPAARVVLLELEGYMQADLPATAFTARRTVRMLLEEPIAAGVAQGLTNSITMLGNLRRNQEGPNT